MPPSISRRGHLLHQMCLLSPLCYHRGHFNVTYISVLTLPLLLFEVINFLTSCRLKIEVRAKGDKLRHRVTQTMGCVTMPQLMYENNPVLLNNFEL